jgi:arginase family enzyme
MFEEFLSPLKVTDFIDVEALHEKQWGRFIHFNENGVDDLTGIDIAIIGVMEDRGSTRNRGCAAAPNNVRHYLYQLYRQEYTLQIADIGNIQRGETVRDTYVAVSKLVSELLRMKIIPVIIGGSHDLTYGQFGGYQELEEIINLTVADSFIDIRENENEITSDNFLLRILTHQPNYLFNYSHIAYQTHFTPTLTIETLDKLHFDCYRLGKLSDNLIEMEPVLRNTHAFSFDISAVRFSDAPGNHNATPNGLRGEQACQLARFAGLSEQLTSFGIYEINPESDIREQTIQLSAQMIWYFVDGYYNRKSELPKDNDERFTKYIVHFKDNQYEMIFWKSAKSDMWWMEVPQGGSPRINRRPQIVPCTYDDYQLACKEELPERWLKAYHKLS